MTKKKREQEEYEYNLKRERELKTNSLKDEISSLEKELAEKLQDFGKKTSAREEELQGRENTVAAAEKEMIALQVRVDNFPSELNEAVKKAAKETTERLSAEAAAQSKLMSNTFEGEKNVLTTKIQALELLTEQQMKQIEQLSSQLEKAYGKVQDIAVNAVSSPRDRYITEPLPKGIPQKDS